MTPPRAPRRRPAEAEIVAIAAAHLNALGYRTWRDLDGGDYFDLVARRGDEVGLVEAKVGDARTVLAQALRRRAWGDWTAVVLAGRRSAERLEGRTRATRAAPVGVWCVADGRVVELRPARPWVADGADDPFAPFRSRFRAILTALERGEIPASVAWDGVPRTVRRVSGGRAFAEWRLDEIEPR
ncbi:MAG TPA: hypothetical protein VMG99_03465 [Thermoplasmata archaeon]|nr:hypothetical protein [Thermoplasmata archaeon]